MSTILIVDDNVSYSERLKKILETAGYQIDISNDPVEGIVMVGQKKYDLIISDLMMDTIDGIKFLQTIKKFHPKMKTIILTGMPTVETELQALDIYVDQYLQKDVHVDLLLKYIETILERENQLKDVKFYSKVEHIECHVESRKVIQNGQEVALSRKEFDLLAYLLEHKNKVITREEFINAFWDVKYEFIDERVIDVHIKDIRRKLGIQSIVSIRGYGYKWVE